MLLHLQRLTATPACTIGELIIADDPWSCWTLEDVIRTGPKVYGKTAIPARRFCF